jgi:parallel beta-helix repeat protein
MDFRRGVIACLRVAVVALALVGLGTTLTACTATAAPQKQAIVRVPQDSTLAKAGGLVADGGIILVAKGDYHGTLDVRADDVTVRGADRNHVVLDGRLELSNGVVASGKRVTVENLTVRNYLQNGVLVTGVTDANGVGVARGPDGYLPAHIPAPVPGYLVQYVTAENNGLYGIYAFNRTGGVIRNNLASGGADSGIYVGQCANCDASVTGNVATSNAVGLELANASDVVVTGNRFARNRIGISVLSNYQEAHGPSRSVQIVGNVISNNEQTATPSQEEGAFGIGIGLGGTVNGEVRANRIEGNRNVGVWVTSSEDFAPTGNRVEGNAWAGNGLDVVYSPTARATGGGNCFMVGAATVTEPRSLATEGCGANVAGGTYEQPAAPPGMNFADVPQPPKSPGLTTVTKHPRSLPSHVSLPDTASIEVPSPNLLEDAAG